MTADVSKALRDKILSYTDVAALVGQRMYFDVLVQNATLPAIAYYKVSTVREHTISNVTDLAHSRFQFDCYATTAERANDIVHAIRKSGICSFRGTVKDIYFCGAEFENDLNGFDSPTDGSQEYRYISTFDLVVHYQEA